MNAEILSTGDEVRTGAIVDSNSAYIAQQLEDVGAMVFRHNCVGDDLDMLAEILTEISHRADICVVTGGLGPTQDDLTAQAAAKAAGVELAYDNDALTWIEALFAARNRPMSPSNKKQALLPVGASCLVNPVGTAPGFVLKIHQCTFFFLPGVPHEMRRMISDHVLPRLSVMQGENRIFYKVKNLSTFGLTEAATGEHLTEIPRIFPHIKLGLRASFPEIHIKLYGQGTDSYLLEQEFQNAIQWIQNKLGIYLLSVEGDSMEKVVGDLLCEKRSTVAIAESCTGGLISHKLTEIPGSSDYFLFSGIAYSNEAKSNVLGVSPETIARYGAVHEITAKEMAQGVKRITGATYGLSTSGIAGPDGGTEDKPVGTVCIGLATPESVEGFRYRFNFGRRSMNKEIFAVSALDILRRKLLVS